METDLRAMATDLRAMETDLRAVETDLRATETDLRASETDLRGMPAEASPGFPLQGKPLCRTPVPFLNQFPKHRFRKIPDLFC